jgi:hypothetical protein
VVVWCAGPVLTCVGPSPRVLCELEGVVLLCWRVVLSE